jgi:deazaflavin-dependent oxidoreductase (nitroreductase family)
MADPAARSVAAELGYAIAPPNAAQRLTQRMASTRAGAWTFSKTIHHLDRGLAKVSKGRVTGPGLLAGLPVLFLTTTGRRSGQPRTMPLIAVPVDGVLHLLGTNFGQTDTPAWVLNLEARPEATVAYRDRSVDVRAVPVPADEVDHVFERAANLYAGYAKYRQRVATRDTVRDIRVFRLEPA